MRPPFPPVSRASLRLALPAALLVAACGEPLAPRGAADVRDAAGARPSLQVGQSSARLLECPTWSTRRATRLVDPRYGGLVSVNGTSIFIPPGAIAAGDSSGAVPVTVTLPASRWLEIDIRVDTAEHYRFASPVIVTVSYAHCSVRGSVEDELTAWFVDGSTRALVDRMEAWVDRRNDRVYFLTEHLSAYALASSRGTPGGAVAPPPPPDALTE